MTTHQSPSPMTQSNVDHSPSTPIPLILPYFLHCTQPPDISCFIPLLVYNLSLFSRTWALYEQYVLSVSYTAIRVTNLSQFSWGFPHFSNESSMPWEPPSVLDKPVRLVTLLLLLGSWLRLLGEAACQTIHWRQNKYVIISHLVTSSGNLHQAFQSQFIPSFY